VSKSLRRIACCLLLLIAAVWSAAAAETGTLTLPEDLKIIEEEAFAGSTSIRKVIIPDGTTEIRTRAFAGSSLEEVYLPDSLTFIAEDAFEGCETLKVTAPQGSYAYRWAKEQGYFFDGTATSKYNTVFFGRYEQDNNTSNGPEAIEWLVLDRNGDELLLLSLKTLDCQQYSSRSSVTWSNSALRTWLNNTFYQSAFTTREKQQIKLSYIETPTNPQYGTSGGSATQDYVFVPSVNEIEHYFVSAGIQLDYGRTAYCHSKTGTNSEHLVWLRSTGALSNTACSLASSVLSQHKVWLSYYGDYVTKRHGEVRPAIWVKWSEIVESSEYTYCLLDEINIEIVEYNGSAKNVVMPSHIDDLKIESIQDYAFSHHNSLANIRIPASVTSIGDKAFFGCSGLKIYGEAGSYAETYAKKHGIPFSTSYYEEVILPGQLVSMSGMVTAENGAGLPGVKVTLYRSDAIFVGETETDGNGRWSFDGLLPNQSYTVYYQLDGYTIETGVHFVGCDALTNIRAAATEGADSGVMFVEPVSGAEISGGSALHLEWTEIENAAYYRYSARHLNQDEAFIFRRQTSDCQAWIPATQLLPGETLQLWVAAFGESDDDMLGQQIIRVQIQTAEIGENHTHSYGDPYNVGETWYRACACGDVVTIVKNDYESDVKADETVTLCPHSELASLCCVCYGCHEWFLTDALIPTLRCVRCDLEIACDVNALGICDEDSLYYQALNSVPAGGNPLDDNWIKAVLTDRMDDYLSADNIRSILNTVKEAPAKYRNLYLYSALEYDLASSTKKTYHDSGTIYINESAYPETSEFLSVWFHEVGHAIDCAADYPSTDTYKGDDGIKTTVLYEILRADAYVTICDAMADIEAGDPELYTWTPADRERIGQAILDPFSETEVKEQITKKRNGDNEITFVTGSFDANLYRVTTELNAVISDHIYKKDHREIVLINSQMAFDIWGGLTNNYLGGGHGPGYEKEYYWFKKNGTPTYAQCTEAFAEFFSGKMINNVTIINNNASLFPLATNHMDRMIDSMLSSFKQEHN